MAFHVHFHCAELSFRSPRNLVSRSLQYGDDYLGNTCGKNNTGTAYIPQEYRKDFSNAPNLYVFSPLEVSANVLFVIIPPLTIRKE